VLDILSEEQKRDRERAKMLEKLTDPVEREKLELKFDTERAKIKQKMRNMVKRHAEEVAHLESSI
jgi:outer membrane protein OmpA-like peptidoglycan-associated protein